MRIQNKQSNKKYIIIGSIVVIVLVLSYAAGAYAYNLWPFASTQTETSTEKSKDSKSSSSEDNTSDSQSESEENKSTEPQQDPSYVDSPVSNQPTNNDPYPISNEHYQIKQNSSTSYSITLYPIVNNPEYSNYNAQLKAYKTEAQDYLKNRYGNIDSFNIEWSPADAATL